MLLSRPSAIDLDREYVRRGGLAAFVKRAWHVVEPNTYRHSWHLDAMCAHLEAVSRGEIRDLVICVPPGASKSLIASTLWPAWDWATVNPARRFLAATYGQELTDKNAKLHRDLVASDWYRERWGDRVSIGRDEVSKVREFKNSAKGWRISTSVGGRATGIHADIHIGDDLVKAQDAEGRAYVDPAKIEAANQFWFSTMATRRADAATLCRVMIAQRLHHEDTPGRCIEAGYTALVLPMEYDPTRPCRTSVYWRAPGAAERTRFEDPRTEKGDLLIPDRFPRAVVDADKDPAKGMGLIAFEAQNQQNPTPREGAIFKNVLAHRWTTLPARFDRKIITVDCAFKKTETSDFVAIQVWGCLGPNFYLIDRKTERMGISDTIRNVLGMMADHPRCPVHVEDKANGPAVIEILRGAVPGIHEWSPGTDSKVGRATAIAHLFQSGNVWLPPDDRAPWVVEYATTLGRFPLVKFDDDVDATAMALLLLWSPRTTQWLDAVAIMSGRATVRG